MLKSSMSAGSDLPRLSAMRSKPLLALAISAFGIGTTEFVIMGLLPDLARSLDISIPKAGTIVSAYALSVTFGSPFLALALSRVDRKKTLLILMSVFLIGNLACSLAPTYGLLIAARILTALCHGAFFGTGSVVAASVVPQNQRAQAVSLMFSGLTLANVLGVPAGTAIGHAFGWRATFLALVPIGIVAAIGLYRLVPSQPSDGMHLKSEFKAVIKPQVQIVLALSTVSSVALFCVFTYIAPILEIVTHLSPHAVTWALVLFGVGITVGNLVGGRYSDQHPFAVLTIGISVTGALLALMPFAAMYAFTALLIIPLWGFIHFAAGAPLQGRIVMQAKNAPNLASTLNQGAFNFGNAMGASLGGLLLVHGLPYRWLALAGAAICCFDLMLVFIAHWLERNEHTEMSI